LAGPEIRIGFSKSESECKAVEPCDELVDQVGRKYVAIAHGKVLTRAEHLAQRRESRKHLGTCVQEVAFRGVVMVLQVADEYIVLIAERMIHPGHVKRSGKLCWWIPVEACGIEPVSHRAEGVGRRFAVDHGHDRGIGSNPCGIIAR